MSDMNTRHKAAAILSGSKLRMLEEAGLMVIEKSQLDEMHADKMHKNAQLTLLYETLAYVDHPSMCSGQASERIKTSLSDESIKAMAERLKLLEQVATQAHEVVLATEQLGNSTFVVPEDEICELRRLCEATYPQPYVIVPVALLEALERLQSSASAWRALFVDGKEGLSKDASSEQLTERIYELKRRERELVVAIEALGAMDQHA